MERQKQAAHRGTNSHLFPMGRRTHHILIIDDNAHIRSVFARQLLFVCREQNLSCALFHVAEQAQTRLTFFDPAGGGFQAAPELDFAIYEANSPRQALSWLSHNQLRRLVIVSDVMMPVDTEVGLEGFLEGLAQLELTVGLLFVSSEAQSQALVQQLLSPQPAYFVIKGGPDWATLPETLVRHIEALQYRQIRSKIGRATAKKDPDTYLVKPNVKNYVVEVKFQPETAGRPSFVAGEGKQASANVYNSPRSGWWARLVHLFSR